MYVILKIIPRLRLLRKNVQCIWKIFIKVRESVIISTTTYVCNFFLNNPMHIALPKLRNYLLTYSDSVVAVVIVRHV